MRVLLLTHRLPYPPNRGDRIRSFQLLSHLATAATVDLVSLVHSDEEERLAAEVRGIAARVAVARVSKPRSMARALLALPGHTPLTHVLLDSPALSASVARMVREARPDVVLAYCSGMARLAFEPPLRDLPFVLDMVDVDSEKWQMLGRTAGIPMRWIYQREARRLRAFEHDAGGRARVTFVVNERERAAMLAVNPGARVEVLSNGIDVERFRPGEELVRTPDVVFCGVFNYEPNERAAIWLAREAWPLVRRERPDATLSLVGMDPSKAVRALADLPGVRVTGTVPDVRPYLWRASVSAAPLQVARGLQNKVLEAIAAGLPCVVTEQVAEGLPDEALPACRIARDADAFARALLELLALPAEQRGLMVGRAGLARLSWGAQFERLVPLLDAVASHAAG